MRYFRIGEVVEILAVQAHVIRYWEQQIPLLTPKYRKNNIRQYSLEDVRLLFRVRHLVINKKYTVQGAYERLLAESTEDVGAIKQQCEEIKDLLLSATLAQRSQLLRLKKLEEVIKDLQIFP